MAQGSSGSPFEIIAALPGDAVLVAPLFDLYRQFYGRASEPEAATRYLEERISGRESTVLMARDLSRSHDETPPVVGFAQLYPSFSSLALRPSWILNDLFVRAEWRGRHVGRQLVEAAAGAAFREGAASLSLATQLTNTTALSLYESLGFVRDTEFIYLTLSASHWPRRL
jgi:ribosomal protein S18 acetylase RimI-like enzyme